jgi:hypothetical protein
MVLSAPSRSHFPGEEYRALSQDHLVCGWRGAVSQAGTLLLLEAAPGHGPGPGPEGRLARWRAPRAVHDPGKILSYLVVTLALGGDCLADVAVLRAQPQLCGPVAPDPVVSRLITALAADTPRALRAIRKARAAARERAWALAGERAPGTDGSLIPVDIDAAIVVAYSPALATGC